MVINFQSWLDPFIISFALPGALAGIVWALFATGSTISVPAFMGAIMSMGVATANSILIVSFANDRMADGRSALEAALEAASTRLRPVVMTALAMIVGMLPMALGARRRRRAERAARSRRHRRPDVRHGRHAVRGAHHVQPAPRARPSRRRPDAGGRMTRSNRRRPVARARRGRVVPIAIVLLLAALFAAGAMPRLRQAQRPAAESAAATEIPTVFTEPVTDGHQRHQARPARHHRRAARDGHLCADERVREVAAGRSRIGRPHR